MIQGVVHRSCSTLDRGTNTLQFFNLTLVVCYYGAVYEGLLRIDSFFVISRAFFRVIFPRLSWGSVSLLCWFFASTIPGRTFDKLAYLHWNYRYENFKNNCTSLFSLTLWQSNLLIWLISKCFKYTVVLVKINIDFSLDRNIIYSLLLKYF